MKIKFLSILLILLFCLYSGQKIKILNIQKSIENDITHYILFCELNNKSNENIILPLPTAFSDATNPNSYNYFYKIKASPKTSISQWEVPPYQLQEVKKLNIYDFVIAKPQEKVKFKINTKYLIFYNNRFNKDIKLKGIQLIYHPYILDKERNLSSSLQDLKIYFKKIISRKYNL